MHSAPKTATMSGIRNNKGFTLIEMAIVLVIIGIILGAVMKGQDLITNAKAKNVGSVANNWKALIYAYVDRNGKLPGDTLRGGQIGGVTGKVTTSDALFQMYSTMTQAPTNPVTVGGASYYFYLANDAAGGGKSVMVICNNAGCTGTLSADEVELFNSIDSSIDGSADAGSGSFRAITTGVGITPGTNSFHNDAAKVTGAPTGMTITRGNVVNTPSTQWGQTVLAAVYYFDKTY